MCALYPLRFEPIFRRYLWGGRRLGTLLGKPIGAGEDYAESWEVADHGKDQSVVLNGPLAGKTLAQLTAQFGDALTGVAPPLDRFPLLLKYLDAHRVLSVQVHPDDARAARLQPPDLGKTEAWVILSAAPGSVLYAGLRAGTARQNVVDALRRGTVAELLHRVEPRVGDCFFIPAGTVHAIGGGLLLAEIQQASDATFRLFDWNRHGPDGQPRRLDIDAALDVIDFQSGPISAQTPREVRSQVVTRLVCATAFSIDRWHWRNSEVLGGDGRFNLVPVSDGQATLRHPAAELDMVRGQSCLVPACCQVELVAAEGCTMLDAHLP